jgi:uncharacterized protein (DUF1501 family)
MNRRDFIKQSGCVAMGSTTLLNTLANLSSFNGAMSNSAFGQQDDGDYKALVCILLSGGIDSYSLLIPSGTDASGDNGFNEYKNIRTDLAIQSASSLLPLNNPQCTSFRNINCNYSSFGVHPQMGDIQGLFNTGKLAFMSNIGTLVEPIATNTQFQSGLKKIPLGIYSHSDQVMQWQTSVPQSRNAVGVGGRIADLMHATNAHQEISMNISLNGKNVFQRGLDLAEYSISNNVNPNNVGIKALPSWWGNSGFLTETRNNTVDSLVSKVYTNLLQKTFATTAKKSIDSFGIFREALSRVPSLTTQFPTTSSLATDLSAIAKVMSVKSYLGMKRQIFFVNYGGWDMHDNLVTGMTQKLPLVSQALKAFYDATVELGIENKVTTFTISDFARTVTSNGLGSDHAWGGNMMVMGGAVNGGKVYGAFPKMSVVNNPQNISFRGNFIPSISTDEMYAELALWYGISPYDLCYVLPNLSNFYSYSPLNYPVGFMNFNGTPISSEDKPQGCLRY